jgi:predicted SprT family Zn-dependent metalloprotease
MASRLKEQPTTETYTVLQQAYDHFNTELFDGLLSNCLITLSAERKNAFGYYRNHPFAHTNLKGKWTNEIALNPFQFDKRSDREIYSTLVHEMVHLWQHHFGTPPKRVYHDKEWADKMESVGLMPSSTGIEGGKRTGRRVSHYIIEGGAFDKAEKKFKGKIAWRGTTGTSSAKKGSKRTKYSCPMCGTNAYGKPGLSLLCGDCDEYMVC